MKNDFPFGLIQESIRKFLNNVVGTCNVLKIKHEKDDIYIRIPYIGDQSVEFGKKVKKILGNYYKHASNIRVVFYTCKLKNFFSLKDIIPKLMKASLVYKFRCRVDPETTYVGMTKRRLHQRMNEHVKRHTAISQHVNNCANCTVDNESFEILYTGRSNFEIQVVEALFITMYNPYLNRTLGYKGSSYFLNVF